ncbi:hypothetical protein [Nocardia sp. XZ_19_385]|uniref:WXG100-like domain-containing protein n=1 Tax=Nocardia sp. XZ_19_385 TaxID=2769488 RepID=UPI00188DE841|nr:hypothetical protein [Nocardia sp. XZ_19_385]
MGLEIPDELKSVAALVVYKWPEADETGLRGAADKWDQMASLLEQLNDYGDDVIKVVLANTEGDTHDAIEQFWAKAGGADGALADLAEFCRQLAFVLRMMAFLVLAVKLFIIAMLVYLVVQLAIAAAAAVPSGGTSVAAGAAVQVSVRLVITQALKKLVQDILVRTIVKWVAKQAAIGAVLGVTQEFAFQSAEIKLGLRDGYDLTDIASKGVHNAIKNPIKKALGDTVVAGLVGDKVADLVWGNESGLVGRSLDTAQTAGEQYVRTKIVEALTEPASTEQQPSTKDEGSSLDLPTQ